jgi:hypothetical protein
MEWEVPSPAPFHTFETPPKLNAAANRLAASEESLKSPVRTAGVH